MEKVQSWVRWFGSARFWLSIWRDLEPRHATRRPHCPQASGYLFSSIFLFQPEYRNVLSSEFKTVAAADWLQTIAVIDGLCGLQAEMI